MIDYYRLCESDALSLFVCNSAFKHLACQTLSFFNDKKQSEDWDAARDQERNRSSGTLLQKGACRAGGFEQDKTFRTSMKSIAFGSCTPNWDIRAVLRFEQPSRQKPSIFAESAQVPGQALAFKFRHSLLEGVGRMPFDLDAVEVFFNGDFDLEVGKVLFWSARAPGAGAADRNLSPGICS